MTSDVAPASPPPSAGVEPARPETGTTSSASHLGRGTLGRKLMVRTLLIVAAMSLLLSAAFALTTQRTLTRALDDQLTETASRDYFFQARHARPGQSEPNKNKDTVTLIVAHDGSTVMAVRRGDVGADDLTAEQIAALRAAPTNARSTMDLPGLGVHRVLSVTQVAGADRPPGPGDRSDPEPPQLVIEALPLASVYAQIGRILAILTGVTLLTLLIAGLLMHQVIVRALRPLNELTEATQAITELDLVKEAPKLSAEIDADERSEVGRLAASFNLMLDHVGSSLTARQASETRLRRFVADASHELRNPLAAIRGYSELTRRDRSALPQDTAFAMERIDSESSRMSSLVEDLLMLARLDQRQKLTLEPVDLSEQLIHAVSDARVAGPEHRWQLDLPREPVTVEGDSHKIYQVLVNLLTNARVHTPAATRVVASLAREGNQAVITIADNGPGIPKDMQSRVFERFARADEARARMAPGAGSTGLGLAIVSSVIAAHEGEVSLTSEPGDTRFTIRLPLGGPQTSSSGNN